MIRIKKRWYTAAAILTASLLCACGNRGTDFYGIETGNELPVLSSGTIQTDGSSFRGKETRKTYPDETAYLIPGGDIFGVKFFTEGVIVVDTAEVTAADGKHDPAKAAGLAKNDIIRRIGGKDVNTVEEIADIVGRSHGEALHVEYLRGGKEECCDMIPVKCVSDGLYKTGLWIRDSTAGIGTVTFYDASDGYFAGLGHGICDTDTGTLMPLRLGAVVDVALTDIVRGGVGCPGELKGTFGSDSTGFLVDNTLCGVSGYMDKVPDDRKALPVAPRDAVTAGDAVILSAIGGSGIEAYSVRLSAVDKNARGTKCFCIEVTDETLLSLSGGIIQGMSGSPIIQNGMIVGAVTHVLISDPTRGYGIFAENMLTYDENAAA